jgi:hypothetical protein
MLWSIEEQCLRDYSITGKIRPFPLPIHRFQALLAVSPHRRNFAGLSNRVFCISAMCTATSTLGAVRQGVTGRSGGRRA